MGSLVIVEFVTLDGVMQGFGSPNEDRDGGFDLGGWGAPYRDEDQMRSGAESLRSTSAYLFGRRTYEKMVEFWPHQPDDTAMAAHLNRSTKHIATRTLTEFEWSHAERLGGDLHIAVTDLKSKYDGNIVVLGSGMLTEQLPPAASSTATTSTFTRCCSGRGSASFGAWSPPGRSCWKVSARRPPAFYPCATRWRSRPQVMPCDDRPA